jgi:hypothetical protein
MAGDASTGTRAEDVRTRAPGPVVVAGAGARAGAGVVHAAPQRVPDAATDEEQLHEHLRPHVRARRVFRFRRGRRARAVLLDESLVERPAASRVHLAYDHVERRPGAGVVAAVAVLVHAPLGLPGGAGPRRVLVVAKGVAVPRRI